MPVVYELTFRSAEESPAPTVYVPVIVSPSLEAVNATTSVVSSVTFMVLEEMTFSDIAATISIVAPTPYAPSALVDVNPVTVGAVVSAYVSVALDAASSALGFKALSLTNPAVTSIASAKSVASPSAAKPVVACRAVLAADVNLTVSVVSFVTTAVSISDAAKVTSDNAGFALLL